METIFRLRKAGIDDLPTITEIYNEAILSTTATFDTEPKNAAEQAAWFESHGSRYPVLVALAGDRIVGWTALSQYSDRRAYDVTAEISTYVKEEFRGKGAGRALKAAIIQQARSLGFHSLVARIAEGSDASLHLNETFGFACVGTLKEVGSKFDKLLDVHILQLMLD